VTHVFVVTRIANLDLKFISMNFNDALILVHDVLAHGIHLLQLGLHSVDFVRTDEANKGNAGVDTVPFSITVCC
jgi:hypothetical protein